MNKTQILTSAAALLGRKGGAARGPSKRRDVDYAELGRMGAKIKKQKNCPHPPARLYAWLAQGVQCVACNDCGKVLAGGA
jgi:hypothetical protein